jgi:hypothetical protein
MRPRHGGTAQDVRRPAAPRPLPVLAAEPAGDPVQGLSRGFWVRLVTVAVAVRVLVVFGALHSMPVVSDAAAYTEQARRLVHHWSTGAYYWPPGESYLMAGLFAVVGDSDTVAKASNIAVDVAAVVLAVLLARRLLTDVRAIRWTGWILAIFPSLVLMSGQPYSFALTMVCLLALALLILRGLETAGVANAALAGGFLGFAILTRPSTISVLPALAIVTGVLARRFMAEGNRNQLRGLIRAAAVFAVVTAAVVAPVVYHNVEHRQGLTVSTANEQNFWFGNNPYTPAYKTWELGTRRVADFAPAVRDYLARYNPGAPTRAQRHAMLHDALTFVAHHPAITLLRTFDRFQAFWGFDFSPSDDVKNALGLGRLPQVLLTGLEALGWVVVGLLALVGLTSARQLIRRAPALLVLAIVVGFEVPYLLSYAAGRWHEPVIGFVVPFAAAGASWLWSTRDPLPRLLANHLFVGLAVLFLAVQVVYAYSVATLM